MDSPRQPGAARDDRLRAQLRAVRRAGRRSPADDPGEPAGRVAGELRRGGVGAHRLGDPRQHPRHRRADGALRLAHRRRRPGDEDRIARPRRDRLAARRTQRHAQEAAHDGDGGAPGRRQRRRGLARDRQRQRRPVRPHREPGRRAAADREFDAAAGRSGAAQRRAHGDGAFAGRRVQRRGRPRRFDDAQRRAAHGRDPRERRAHRRDRRRSRR